MLTLIKSIALLGCTAVLLFLILPNATSIVKFSQSHKLDDAANKIVVDGELGAKLDELLTRYQQYGFSGTVLIARAGRVVLHKGYGLADREKKIANTTNTLFEMGSLTKTFTAAAILRLEMQGRLKTSDSISKYLGEFPKPKAAATIHHLLTHTAGLMGDGATRSDDGSDREKFIQGMKDTPIESPPGEKYRYTNAGYSLAAAIIEKVSGQSLETFVREQLFKPAGMTNAGFRGDFNHDDLRLSRGYLGTPERIEEGPPLAYLWGTRGAGGIISTVEDIYAWHLALQGKHILSEAAKEKAFYPWSNEGYGWHVQTDSSGRRLIQKGGGQANFASHFLFYPDDKLVIVWASNNLQQRWRQALNRAIPRAVFDENYILPPTVVDMDTARLRRYAGLYAAASGGKVQLRSSNGYLFSYENDLSLPISVLFFPQSPTTFNGFDVRNLKLVSLRFTVSDDGSVQELILSYSDKDIPLRKASARD